MNTMSEFMNRELIREKIDEISDKFFDFHITHDGVRTEVEDDMHNMLMVMSNEIAKKGELNEQWPMAIGYLIDTVLAQLIVIKLQNKFIEKCKRDKDDDEG